MFKDKVDISKYCSKDLCYNYICFNRIVREDYLDRKSEYYYVDELIQGRSALKNYASLSTASLENFKMLLVSDLHLGDKNFETKNLINNLYLLAEKCGVSVCMILGDVLREEDALSVDNKSLL